MRLCNIQTGRKERDDVVDSQTGKVGHLSWRQKFQRSGCEGSMRRPIDWVLFAFSVAFMVTGREIQVVNRALQEIRPDLTKLTQTVCNHLLRLNVSSSTIQTPIPSLRVLVNTKWLQKLARSVEPTENASCKSLPARLSISISQPPRP